MFLPNPYISSFFLAYWTLRRKRKHLGDYLNRAVILLGASDKQPVAFV